MKNVAIVNTVAFGSTGKIALNLYSNLKDKGYNAFFCYGHGSTNGNNDFYVIDKKIERYTHSALARLFGNQGCYSYFATKRLIRHLKKNSTDTVILLSPHGCYLNQPVFFDYVAKENITLFYIMIDEYPYVGYCAGTKGCTRYQIGCGQCEQKKSFPRFMFFDRSSYLYKMKMKNYSKVKRIGFAGPEFVITQASLSPMMKGKKLFVLDESINVTIYAPKNRERIKEKLKIDKDKIIILTIASSTTPSKGAQYVEPIANKLSDDNRFLYIHIDGNITGITHQSETFIRRGFVESIEEVVEYLSIADLFYFPSIQDTMSNTCLEALACGTPLLCFNISGMPYLGNEDVMKLVEVGDVDNVVRIIKTTHPKTEETIERCRNYALSRYDSRNYCDKVINIVKEIETTIKLKYSI